MALAHWTPVAIDDLENILVYISTHDYRPIVARTIGEEIHALCTQLANSPKMGRERPELGSHIRSFPYKRWIIIYRPSQQGIFVLSILDAARDYAALFKT